MAPSTPNVRKTALWLCAAALVLAWLPRMPWGFWSDETATFWMAAKGWREAIPRTAGLAGQSILYAILESFFLTTGPWAEALMRVPSLAAMAIAAWQLKRIAELVISAEAGWIALVVFLCAPDAANFGTSARPYSLALAAALASFRYLLEWQEGAHGATIAKYIAASVLTLYFHYLFGFVFVVQGLYLAYCWLRGERLRWDLPVAAVIALPLSLLPLISVLRSTAGSNWFQAAKPDFINLLWISLPPAFLLGVVLGGVMLFAAGRSAKWRGVPVRTEFAFLVIMWLLLAPVVFFAISYLTPNIVFSARYLLFVLPASVLLVTWVISGFERRESRIMLAVSVFAAGTLHPGLVMQNWRPSMQSWREPLAWIAAQNETPAIFMTSALANAQYTAWQSEDPHESCNYAPLMAYPIANKALPLPWAFDEGVQKYIQASDIHEPRYLLLAAGDSPVVAWMTDYMKQAGFRSELHEFNDYVVVDFRSAHFQASGSIAEPPRDGRLR